MAGRLQRRPRLEQAQAALREGDLTVNGEDELVRDRETADVQRAGEPSTRCATSSRMTARRSSTTTSVSASAVRRSSSASGSGSSCSASASGGPGRWRACRIVQAVGCVGCGRRMTTVASMIQRVLAREEQQEVRDGVVWSTVMQPHVRLPARPVVRHAAAQASVDVADVLARLPKDEQRMALRLLRQGLGKWRQWNAVLRRPPAWLDVPLAERTLLPLLLRAGAVQVRERYVAREGRWELREFRSADAVRDFVGRPEPDVIAAELEIELTTPPPREALAAGKPTGWDWPAFAFVLRAADAWLIDRAHGVRRHERELAAELWHSKAFRSRARVDLLAEIVGCPADALFEPKPRKIGIKGPLVHEQASVYADDVPELALQPGAELHSVLCVENETTFTAVLPYARRGWLLIWIPGSAPEAEARLLGRVSAIAPDVPVLAAFDPDPAGVRIALSLARRSGVQLDPAPMSSDALEAARKLDLDPWDREELDRLDGAAGRHQDLLDAVRQLDRKGEQESFHPWLIALLEERTEAGLAARA